jgi:hypothetical protein
MDMWLELHEARFRDLVREAETAARRRDDRRVRWTTVYAPGRRVRWDR